MWAKAFRSSLKHLEVIKSSCLISISSITKSARCIMSSSSQHCSHLSLLELERCVCATLITFSDRTITGNIKTHLYYIYIKILLYGCISEFHSHTGDTVGMFCRGACRKVLNAARNFQTRLFLNSPAYSQSLWVITTRITMLIV